MSAPVPRLTDRPAGGGLGGVAALEQGKDPLPRVDFVRLEGYVLVRVYGSSDLARICKTSLLSPEDPAAG